MQQLLPAILLSLLASQGWAGDAVGKVGKIKASPTSHFVMFAVRDNAANYHRCNESGLYSIDLRGPGAQASYQLLLLAKQQQYVVRVTSLNTCNPFDAENLRQIELN